MATNLKMQRIIKKRPRGSASQKNARGSARSRQKAKAATNKFSNNFKSLKLNLHGVRLPSFDIPKEEKRKIKVSEDIDNYDFLRALCFEGFKTLKLRKGTKKYNAYADRIKHELTTLKELGFIDYVLLVWDVINFCKKVPSKVNLIEYNKVENVPYEKSTKESVALALAPFTSVIISTF